MGLGVMILVASLGPRAHGFDLRIGTRTRLKVKVGAEGTQVSVDGNLRDNVGQGVEGETITFEFRARGAPGAGVISRDARTDRTGRFYKTITLEPGKYDVEVHFAGREHYYSRSSYEGAVASERGKVQLSLQAPDVVLREAGTVQIRAAATNGASPLDGLPLTVSVDGEDVSLRTGKEGMVQVPVVLGERSGARVSLLVLFEGTQSFEPARAEASVRVLDAPVVTLEADNIRARLTRGVQVQGAVIDRHGEVAGGLVDVILAQKGVEVGRYSARTDDDGEYEIFIPEDRLKEGALEVRARLSVGRGVIEAERVEIEVTRTGGGVLPWLLGIILGLTALVIAGAAIRDAARGWKKRRPGKKRRKKRSLERARAPRFVPADDFIEEEDPSPPGPRNIAGAICDEQTRMPIEGARVEVLALDGTTAGVEAVVTGAHGIFRFRDLPDGELLLRARAKGYVTGANSFAIPHRGALSAFRFSLVPVRAVIRDLYEDMVEDVTAERGSWGRLTPRQVRRLLMRAVEAAMSPQSFPGGGEGYRAFKRRLEEALGATRDGQALSSEKVVATVIGVLEEVYYSQRLHDEALAVIMERLVDELRRQADAQDGEGGL